MFPKLAMRLTLIIAAVLIVATGQGEVRASEPGAPGKPTNLTGTVTHDTVTLSWDAPTSSTVTGYQILRLNRAIHDLGDFQVHVDNTASTTTTYTDTDVEAESRYVYRVKARNGDLLSARSNFFNADLPDAPDPEDEAPAAPTGLNATATHDSVTLTWTAPADSTVTGYQILRRQSGVDELGSFHVHLDNTGNTDTSYTDTDVAAESGYVYRVKARNGDLLSPWSKFSNTKLPVAPVPNPQSIKDSMDETPAAPTGLTSSNTYIAITLSWNDPKDETVTGYQVLRRDRANAGDQFAVLVDDTETTDTSYTDSHIAPKAEYEYQVNARNEHGISAASTGHSVDIPPDPDSTITGAIDLGDLTAVTEARSPEYEINGYGDRLDYFRFTLTEPRSVILGLSHLDFDADLLLFKDNTSFTLLGESRTDGTSNEDIAQTLLEGSYLVLVTAEEQGANSYELRHGTEDPDTDKVEELREEATAVNPPPRVIVPVDPPPSAEAQGDVTLVSNLSETSSGSLSITSNQVRSIKFINGSNEGGYFLSSVIIKWGTLTGSVSDLTVTIDQGGLGVGATLATLTNPSPLVAEGDNVFTASTSVALEADTDYFISIRNSGSAVTISKTDSLSHSGEPDWDIPFTHRFYNGTNWSVVYEPLQIAVSGQIKDSATGAPTISGTPAVSRTLTADTSGISDPDGLTNVSYSYQWIRVDGDDETDIAGANSRSYTLVDDDEGKSVKVRVDFQDDLGTEESLTSEEFPDSGTIYTAVELLRVGVRPTRVELRYADELQLEDPPASAFSISINGEPEVNPTRTRVADEIFTVLLKLPTPISQGDSVTVSYTPPTDNPIRDGDNNPALGFTSLSAVDITGTWDGVFRVQMEKVAYQITEPRDGQVEVTVGIVSRSPVLEFDLPPDLRFWVEIRTHGGTAKSGEDFVPVKSRRVEMTGTEPSYTTLLINADGIMEGRSETFSVGMNGNFGGGAAQGAARINDTRRSTVTIADVNKASLEVIATPARVLEGQTRDVTLEIRATDDDGSSSDECQIALPTDNIRLRVETDATADDYAYTVTDGNLNDIDLPACGSATVKLRLEAKSDSDAQEFEEDINFRIRLPSTIDTRVQRNLLRSARVVIADPFSNVACEHERVVWCADLTAGPIYSGSKRIGTGFLDDRATQVGSLSPARFSYQSIAFSLKMLDLGHGALSTVEVLLRPYPVGVFGRNHKLHMGNRVFRFSDGTYKGETGTFTWLRQGGSHSSGQQLLIAISRDTSDVTPPKQVEAWVPLGGDRVILEFGEEFSRATGTLLASVRDAFLICSLYDAGCPQRDIQALADVALEIAKAELLMTNSLDGNLEHPCNSGETPCISTGLELERKRVIRLTLASEIPLYNGQRLLVSYDPGRAEPNALEDAAGNDLRSFNHRSVSNFSAVHVISSSRLTPGLVSGGPTGYCVLKPGFPNQCVVKNSHAPYGSLRDAEFQVEGTTYKITSLRYGSGSDGNLFLTLDRALPNSELDKLTLLIGDKAFPMSEATEEAGKGYKWADHSQPWTVGTGIAVKFTRTQ